MLARKFAIAATVVHVDYQVQDYYVSEPVVLATVLGDVTNVAVAHVAQNITGLGYVYTGLDLTFQAGAVGKNFSLLVMGA